MITRQQIPLSAITGISPLNMHYDRVETPDSLASLIAAIEAEGLLQPLTLIRKGDGFEVLAGRRRFQALELLYPAGTEAQHALIEANVFDGDDAEAALLSIMENIERINLHPVDQYEAYARAIGLGATEADVRRTFGLTERHVRERMALARLSPKVRAAWRKGDLTAVEAKLFTLGSIEEQDALLEEPAWAWNQAHKIRAHFKKEGVPGDDPRAVYIGREAYRAAGGAIEETIFETFFSDDKLLDRLVAEKLTAKAEAICAAEGWGMVHLTRDLTYYDKRAHLPDLTEAEEARCREIEEIDGVDIDDETYNALQRESHAITQLAILRAIPEAERASLGLYAFLDDDDGQPIFFRGVIAERPKASVRSGEVTGTGDTRRAAKAPATSELGEEPLNPSKRGRDVLDAAIAKGLQRAVASRPDLALMILVARLSSIDAGGASAVNKTAYPDQLISPLFAPMIDRHKGPWHFDAAIAHLACVPLADLSVMLAEQVAHCLAPQKASSLFDLDPLVKALAMRGANLRSGFLEGLDYAAYFDSATKQNILAVLDALEIVGIDRAAKKDVLAAQAAKEAAARQWLPEPLRGWAEIVAAPHTTAKTTVALAQEELLAGIKPLDADTALIDQVRQFIDEACDRSSSLITCRVLPDDLYEEYRSMAYAFDWPLADQGHFDIAVIALGFRAKPHRGETYFEGLSLKAVASAPKHDDEERAQA